MTRIANDSDLHHQHSKSHPPHKCTASRKVEPSYCYRNQREHHARREAPSRYDAPPVFGFDRRSPHRRHPQNVMYNNGLQIFIMGFMEAGKTADALAVEAARNIVDQWTIGSGDDGERRWDPVTGREIYDANVVEYTRDLNVEVAYHGDGTRPRRRRKRWQRNPSELRKERDQHYGITRQWEEDESELEVRGEAALSFEVEQWRRPVAATMESDSTPMQKRPTSHSRNQTYHEGKPKPIYGLYGKTDTRVQQNDEENKSETQHAHQHKQQWKDRLRLESSSSTNEQSYYNSWKRCMEGREEEDSLQMTLRQKMNNDTESTNAPLPSAAHPSTIPQNCRAKMRPPKIGASSNKTTKLHLDENPFWKERRSAASMLLDNRPASWRKDMQKKRRNTLEEENACSHPFSSISLDPPTVFGTICRWAGVWGTIPQQIVIITVSTMILSGQQKLLTVGLTLLAIRMMGEFFHGSVHGNEFWDGKNDSGQSHLLRVQQ
ncbi:hypothetical protein ACHAW6_001581 [Cyclotella cf. meneghiniana]